jgi:hypothetical protein
MNRWQEVERNANRLMANKANWQAWEIEMTGRAAKARLGAHADKAVVPLIVIRVLLTGK